MRFLKHIFFTIIIFMCLINSRTAFSATNKLYLNGNGDLMLNTKIVVKGYKFYKLYNYDDFSYLISNSKNDNQLYLINKKNYTIKKITNNRFAYGSSIEGYITCRYGKVYYFDGKEQERQLKYSDGNTIKVLEQNVEFNSDAIKFFGDNFYYYVYQSGDYCHINTKTAQKVVDIKGLGFKTMNIIYQNSNKILYSKDNSVWLKKGNYAKRLFYIKNGISILESNLLIDNNNYYFITGLKDGIYLYNINNDSCKNILADKILFYDIHEQEDEQWRYGMPNRSGHITELNFRYIDSNYNVKLFNLKNFKSEILVKCDEIISQLKAEIDMEGVNFIIYNIIINDDNNIDIVTYTNKGMNVYRFEVYRYNKNLGKMWLYKISDQNSNDAGTYNDAGKIISNYGGNWPNF